jgi:hypothetical protein
MYRTSQTRFEQSGPSRSSPSSQTIPKTLEPPPDQILHLAQLELLCRRARLGIRVEQEELLKAIDAVRTVVSEG